MRARGCEHSIARRALARELRRVLIAAALAVACGARTDLELAPTNFGGNHATGEPPDAEKPPSHGTSCPGRGGPTMVRLPEGYCIDSTEVTRAQYGAWLATKPSTAGQASTCSENATFTPEAACMEQAACRSACDHHPQVCVEWCDAQAYCRAVGKRLCGKIGGGPNPYGDYAWTDPNLSEWFNACSAHGMQKYATGKTYEPKICNGPSFDGATTLPVGSLSRCQSPIPEYAGIYDLSGNVSEWEDSCESGSCRLRGGSYLDGPSDFPVACVVDSSLNPYLAGVGTTWTVGFRCCSSP